MFEGKHIHYSPTDNKPLCSYSGKVCRQRRLNGYAFCIRHILEDKSAPFKQCSYVTRNNSQKCLNAIPSNQDRGYCHSHMQVIGIIPKTERKSKTQSIKSDNSSSKSSNASDKSPPTSAASIKKDPGAVFKFEEDSSDITDVYSYKNGLLNGSPNGRGKISKSKDSSSSSKDIQNVKSQNIFCNSTSFTTRKITDKNKNVYTAIIPTSNCVTNKAQLKSKNNVCNSSAEESLSTLQQKSSARLVHLNIRLQKDSNGGSSELKSHDAEEIRQFEQLKTLKQLDKSLLTNNITFEQSGDAKLKIFPRLAASSSSVSKSGNSSWSSTNHPRSDDSTAVEERKSEILFTPPAPPLITRSNNGIIIKTEPIAVISENKEPQSFNRDVDNFVGIQHSGGVLLSSGNNTRNCSYNDHCNSIDSKDLKSRHEFLAHVRNTFKSQYKTIKKACKVSEKCERNSKQRFRDSLMRCIRIDSSICAQVLSGYGLKFQTPSPLKSEPNSEKEDLKFEYDDYDFLENVSSPASNVDQRKKNTSGGSSGKKKGGKESKKLEDGNKSFKDKAQRRSNSGNKWKELEVETIVELSGGSEKTTHDRNLKANKRMEKGKPSVDFNKEVKATKSMSSKKKLKRADAIIIGPDSLGSNILNSNQQSKDICESRSPLTSFHPNAPPEISTGGAGKRRRLELNEASGSELGLALHSQSSPGLCNISSAFDMGDHIATSAEVGILKCEKSGDKTSSAHHHLNQRIGSTMNDVQEIHDMLNQPHSQLSSSHHNQGLETVLNSVGSSENAGTPDGVITDASFDSTFEHSTSSQPECDFSEDDLEHSFTLQIDPEIESQASRLLEDNVLTEADFTELFPDNRMSDHKFGRNDLQELGMAGLEFDVNDMDYSLFANIFPNFPRTSQPESISISNPF